MIARHTRYGIYATPIGVAMKWIQLVSAPAGVSGSIGYGEPRICSWRHLRGNEEEQIFLARRKSRGAQLSSSINAVQNRMLTSTDRRIASAGVRQSVASRAGLDARCARRIRSRCRTEDRAFIATCMFSSSSFSEWQRGWPCPCHSIRAGL